ncbi:MAG: L-histidine N(alpha)-methyltransferase [Fimbriimonadaceae bacterium]|nr:L-histidine N(alpha)-methyltransferase [Alphaproteobacteria bacterium]
MRSLNYKGMTDSTIGCTPNGKICLADALNETCDIIAQTYNGAAIDYVELGPEPVKTELILSALKARGVDIASYISVDINPASAAPMREIVGRLLKPSQIHHVAANFNELTRAQLNADHPILITSLGFQEGNHMPRDTRDLLQRISTNGDSVLSEMQVVPPTGWDPIIGFYELDEMRRFSKNCVSRAYGMVDSKYHIAIADISVDGLMVPVAVTGEEFLSDSGETVFYVTNYCLKYTKSQFRDVRQRDGLFDVISEVGTSDQSVIFQLAKRQ